MDIKTVLLKEHSKETTLMITKWIGADPDRFSKLMDLFLSEEYRVVQRSAWVMSHVGCEYPKLFEPHIEGIMAAIKNPLHPAVRRNVLKVLAETNVVVPEDLEGELVEMCFEWLTNLSTPVAIQAFSMSVVGNICQKYPELSGELRDVLETQMEYGSAGFKSRAKKVLKSIG